MADAYFVITMIGFMVYFTIGAFYAGSSHYDWRYNDLRFLITCTFRFLCWPLVFIRWLILFFMGRL